MSILTELCEIGKERKNFYIDNKKEYEGVMGYFCSYVPEEIISAANFIPYRMRATGSNSTNDADIYFAKTNCSYVRHLFNQVLNNKMDFLDGIIFIDGCDHSRRLYDNWRYAGVGPGFKHILIVPNVINASTLVQFETEVKDLKTAIEAHYNLKIHDSAIIENIKKYNRKRKLIARLYEMRRSENVSISGSELLLVLMAVTSIPIDQAIDKLEKLISEISQRNVSKKDDIRVMFFAAHVEEDDHLKLIEDLGAIIVADRACVGIQNFDGIIDENAIHDPIQVLTKRYLEQISCARMMNDLNRRIDFIFKMAEEYNVDAIIFERLEFCTLMGGENFIFKEEADKRNIPALSLDRELYGKGTGQMKTRIQAFFEEVRNRKQTLKG